MTLKVTTESGTTYLVEGDTVTRLLGEGSGTLRRDGEPIQIIEWVVRPVVGRCMSWVLDVRGDGILTGRTTTKVTDIVDVSSTAPRSTESDETISGVPASTIGGLDVGYAALAKELAEDPDRLPRRVYPRD